MRKQLYLVILYLLYTFKIIDTIKSKKNVIQSTKIPYILKELNNNISGIYFRKQFENILIVNNIGHLTHDQ